MADETKNKEPLTREEADKMANIVDKIREKAEQFGTESAEFKSYMEKADKDLKELDEKHEALVAQIKAKEEQEKEFKARIEHLENLGAIASNNKDKKEDINIAMNALFKNDWVQFSQKYPDIATSYIKEAMVCIETLKDNVPAEISKFKNAMYSLKASNDMLRTDIGELGGFLLIPQYSNTIIKQEFEYSPIRRYANVETMSGKSLTKPILQSRPKAYFEGEAEAGTKTAPKFVTVTLTPHRITCPIYVTWDELNMAGYNVANIIRETSAEAFAQVEGEKAVSGNGIKEYKGFLVDVDIPEYETETTTLQSRDLIKITGKLKKGYNPMFFMNRETLVDIRLMEDDVGRYIWIPPFGDMASGMPATISGVPYSAEFIDMDDNASGYYPLLYADMKRFYHIVDRTDMIVIRDETTLSESAIVKFVMHKWSHGQPAIKEAGVRLKVKS
jgi:HK97 family phage major capsid protein